MDLNVESNRLGATVVLLLPTTERFRFLIPGGQLQDLEVARTFFRSSQRGCCRTLFRGCVSVFAGLHDRIRLGSAGRNLIMCY